MSTARRLIVLGLGLASGVVSTALFGQEAYPTRTIRVIMPFPAGRGADVQTRQIAAKMQPVLGQAVVIENRPGASGIIGTEYAAKAKPDGYTLYAGTVTSVAMVPYMYSKLPFDMERDFVAISQFVDSLIGIATPPAMPAKSMKELIDISHKRPLNVATSGAGSNAHLGAAWFAMLTGAKFNYIHYNATHWEADLMAGRVDLVFGSISSFMGPYKGGKVKMVVITGKERNPVTPDVRTFAESGLAEFNPSGWTGLFAPAGVPQPIIDQLARAVAVAAKSSEVIDQYRSLAMEAVGNTPAEFTAFVKSEQARWSKVIKAANVKLD